jgi:Cu+-exporting ATPase
MLLAVDWNFTGIVAVSALIPLLGLGAILNPIYAAVAMALSSITVTLNSMLLNRWRPRT